MSDANAREGADPVSAIERLVHRHKLLSPEQGRLAARLITGSEAFEASPPVAGEPRERELPGSEKI